MAREPILDNQLYAKHQLESGVRRPFGDQGFDASAEVEARVLNPDQPVASPRALAGNSLGSVMDIDTSFVFEGVLNKKPAHINMLESAMALRHRMLRHVARAFDFKQTGFEQVLSDVGVDYQRPNFRVSSLGLDFLDRHTGWDRGSFGAAATEYARSSFKIQTDRLRSSRRGRLSANIEDYLGSEYVRISRLEGVVRTGTHVVNAIKRLHYSVRLGQTPDLVTVQRILHTAEPYDQMPTLLSEIAFYGLTDPARIFLDFSAHSDMFQVMIFLGKANYGLISPTRRQAGAYLKEIMDEDRDTSPLHTSMRNLLLINLEKYCDWYPQRMMLANVCREVLSGARPDNIAEQRQLWYLR